MPKVGKGDKAVEFPYTKEGMEAAEDYSQQTNQEIDYSPGGEANAPDMRESYQLGGQIPGQPGFGQRPLVNPRMNPSANVLGPQNPEMNPERWGIGDLKITTKPPSQYKKGGKVKRTKSRKQRKKEVMEANLSPRDKFKGTDEEFIKSRKKK